MTTKNRSWVTTFFVFLIAFIGLGSGCPSTKPTVRYVLVSVAPVSPGVADYEFSLELTSHCYVVVPGFVGTVTSTNPTTTTVLEGEIVVGSIAPGATRGTPDTFRMRAPTLAPADFTIAWTTAGASEKFASATIGITGGTVATRDNNAGATFLGNFAVPAVASVYVTDQPSDRQIFWETADIYGRGPADSLELRVQVSEPPPGDGVVVWYQPFIAMSKELWARIPQKTDYKELDAYVPIIPTTQIGGILRGSIPSSAFKACGTGCYEAVVVAAEPRAHATGATQTAIEFEAQSSAAAPPTIEIECPLAIACTQTGAFAFPRIFSLNLVDLAATFVAPQGSVVRTVAPGVVESSYYSQVYGETILIVHPNGMVSRYSHLSSRNVFAGHTVIRGESIGLSGATGMARQPHLALEMTRLVDGQPYPIDPMTVMVPDTITIPFTFTRIDPGTGEHQRVGLLFGPEPPALVGEWDSDGNSQTFNWKVKPGTYTVTIYGSYYASTALIPKFRLSLGYVGVFVGTGGMTYQTYSLNYYGPSSHTFQVRVP